MSEPLSIGARHDDFYPFAIVCGRCEHVLMEHKGVRFPVPFSIAFTCPRCGEETKWVTVND